MEVTPSTRLSPAEQVTLLRTASRAIEETLTGVTPIVPAIDRCPPALAAPGASFVTIERQGELRGCCGTLEARHALLVDVWRNARTSAFEDPRFPPLSLREWRDSQLEISVLSGLERLVVADEAELLARLEPGVHGLVLAHRCSRTTFLPRVWKQLPVPADFVAHLKLKAGWPEDFWAPDLEIHRYTVEVVCAEAGSADQRT
jgi:AmmeMemoRadiSam system protein A